MLYSKRIVDLGLDKLRMGHFLLDKYIGLVYKNSYNNTCIEDFLGAASLKVSNKIVHPVTPCTSLQEFTARKVSNNPLQSKPSKLNFDLTRIVIVLNFNISIFRSFFIPEFVSRALLPPVLIVYVVHAHSNEFTISFYNMLSLNFKCKKYSFNELQHIGQSILEWETNRTDCTATLVLSVRFGPCFSHRSLTLCGRKLDFKMPQYHNMI